MSDRWAELRLRKTEPTVTPSLEEEQERNISVPYFGDGQKASPESNVQLHGLYQEDLAEGIICTECKRIADMPNQFGQTRPYKDVVSFNHRISPR